MVVRPYSFCRSAANQPQKPHMPIFTSS